MRSTSQPAVEYPAVVFLERIPVVPGLRVGLAGLRRGSIGRPPRLQPRLVASLVVVHEQAALAFVAAAAHEVAAGI